MESTNLRSAAVCLVNQIEGRRLWFLEAKKKKKQKIKTVSISYHDDCAF